ncbi:putative component of anaerobic dehydrogenase [Desulfitobacterium dichloroeliminans LMG P-21439]|uniref:Putative component of anaerobic dehydrogenase n=1 Tax=Desulfitobacterium dichloroeliminans (strain LMG P-21439 / DCA1) TaxID=871963 RepID=L0FBE2_DESDL|nr:molecular chaperone TorD family protein [Desulfitobacterium dichloroeliminans]AGA70350.1 putative component of anaerobic dehydrogenase [Desulfitobacterium dichloroeliminans LMG P-21439]
MNNNVLENKVAKSFAISDLYQLLSLSLRLPTHELAEALLNGSYRQDSLNILEELSCSQEDRARVGEAFGRLVGPKSESTPFLIKMRREYTRLFDDPKKPALNIYETLYLHDPADKQGAMLFMSPAALDAERCYKDAGVILVNQSAEPADHLATELEFMLYLHGKKGKAMQEQNLEEIEKMEKQIQQFETLHLKKWCPSFFERLENEAKCQSYQAIALLAKIGLAPILV